MSAILNIAEMEPESSVSLAISGWGTSNAARKFIIMREVSTEVSLSVHKHFVPHEGGRLYDVRVGLNRPSASPRRLKYYD